MADENGSKENTGVLGGIASVVSGAVSTVTGAVTGAVSTVIGGNTSEGTADTNAETQSSAASGVGGVQTQAQAAQESQLPEYLRRRRAETGRVVSDKMEKTVVVSVDRSKRHPIYKKVMRLSVKFMAHDEMGAGIGDTVRIVETRPMSKRKRWQVVEIIKKAERV